MSGKVKESESISHSAVSQLFVTSWTAAHQAPLSMEYSKPLPSPGDLSDPRIEPWSPGLQADSLPSEPPGSPSI